MRIVWISAFLALALFASLALSAPAAAKEEAVKTTSTATKTSTKSDEKDKKATVAKVQTEAKKTTDEFNVPSSKLDNGDTVKPASLVQAASKTETHHERETSKSGSKQENETEAKLLSMLFDGEDTKTNPSKSEEKHSSEEKKHKKVGKKKKTSGHFNVLKVKKGHSKRDRHGKHHDKIKHHHKYHKYDYEDQEEKHDRLKWKGPNYMEDDYDSDRGYARRKDDYDQRRYRDEPSYGKRHRPHEKHEEYDDGRVRTYYHTENFKGKVSPSELGFDKERIESIFGSAYRPGGFGAESMNHLTHSRKMFSHGFHGHY